MDDLQNGKKIVEDGETTDIERLVHEKTVLANYGDLVIVYETRDSIKFFILTQGAIFQNKNGHFKHDDIYGKPYGTKIHNFKQTGYITILSFVTNLWERCINRMTQILFNPDISMIMTFLNIKNDSIIYESGTGSGCLSTNMSQVLQNYGHLYTFEFNKERADKLRETFQLLGLSNTVTITNRDVIEHGFELDRSALKKKEHATCDGIFIDLPSPWLIVDKAKKVLRNAGKFVSFSPCIEQVSETMKALQENGFINVRMVECLYRQYNYVKSVKVNVPNFTMKRKFGEEYPTVEKELPLSFSRNDMRGHTGFLIYAINFIS
jgi:tRNA (adenine57-N1/adenine58-N1)-methyltransferase